MAILYVGKKEIDKAIDFNANKTFLREKKAVQGEEEKNIRSKMVIGITFVRSFKRRLR